MNGPTILPRPQTSWEQATRIIGDGEEYFNDFTLIQDARQRWHCMGMCHESWHLFHAVSEQLTGPYQMLGHIETGDAQAEHAWAPYAFKGPEESVFMYYSHQNRGQQEKDKEIRLLTSCDPLLEVWQPYAGDLLKTGNCVFAEPAARDVCLLYDEKLCCYLMYYIAHTSDCGLLENDSRLPCKVRLRTSQDLYLWSEPVTVMGIPADYVVAESPFVLKRNGLYYLWVCGWDSGRMALYISSDPFDFGDPVADLVTEQSGHAPEIVTHDGKDYMACSAVSSKFGYQVPGEHDLKGVYIQEIVWE